jgi:hypothetical protein
MEPFPCSSSVVNNRNHYCYQFKLVRCGTINWDRNRERPAYLISNQPHVENFWNARGQIVIYSDRG